MNSLPTHTTPVRLNRHEFVKPHFNVDKFLHQSRKHVSWEDMKEDLHVYLKILQNSMIELINKDYADFVNLSTNLVNLKPVIDKTKQNLVTVQHEFDSHAGQLQKANSAVVELLGKKRDIVDGLKFAERRVKLLEQLRKLNALLLDSSGTEKTEHFRLHDVPGAETADDFDCISRLANLFSSVSTLCTDVDQHPPKFLDTAAQKFCDQLNHKLEQALDDRNSANVRRLLKAYAAINRPDAAQSVLVRKFFSFKPSKTERRLKKNEQLSLALKHLSDGLTDLRSISDASPEIELFVHKSMLGSLDAFVDHNLNDVLIPVDAPLFHACYSAISNFGEELSTGSNIGVQRILHKFNLSVYARLVVQDVKKNLEDSANEDLQIPTDIPSLQALQDTPLLAKMKDSIARIWSDEIFLENLTVDFWEFSLESANFYLHWNRERGRVTTPPPPKENATSAINGFAGTEPDTKMAMYFVADLFNFRSWFHDFCAKTIHARLGDINLEMDPVKLALEDVNRTIDEIVESVMSSLARQVTLNFQKSMAAVSEIPRQYRWTRKERPTQPSVYLEHAFAILNDFSCLAQPIFGQDRVADVLQECLTSVLAEYIDNIRAVLVSVDKVSSSLSKLKKSATRPDHISETGDVLSDDDKIKLQLKIDVAQLRNELVNFPTPAVDVSALTLMLGN